MIANLAILPLVANWADPVKVTWAFQTTGREGLSGAAWRDSARAFARRTVEFNALAFESILRQWLAWVEAQPAGITVFGSPLWSDLCALTVAAGIGDTTLAVTDTANLDLRTEVILASWDLNAGTMQIEAATIESVAGNQITLTSGLAAAFAAGACVMPLVRGRFTAPPQATLAAPRVVSLPVTAVEDPAAMTDSALAYTAPTYRGAPIFPLVPNWSTSPTQTLDIGAKLSAAGINRESWAATRDYARLAGTMDVMTLNRASAAALVRFFLDRRGRWQRFWMPIHSRVTTIAANIGVSDTTITINDYAAFAALYNSGGSRNVTISISDGYRVWFRRVTGLDAQHNRITIDAALGTAIVAPHCAIAPLKLVRFGTDDLVLNYVSPLVATATLAFDEAEKEYTEALATGGTFNGRINRGTYLMEASA